MKSKVQGRNSQHNRKTAGDVMSSIGRGLKQGIIGASVLLIFSSCASTGGRERQNAEATANKNLEEKIAAEAPANDPEAIGNRAAEAFGSAKGISIDQKVQLLTIYRHTYDEAVNIRVEIGKSKSLLFKLVSSAAYDSKDVEQIKKRVVELDQKRLNLMFKALADVQAVVGYGKGKEDLYKHFFDFEYPRHGNLSRGQ